MKYVSEPVLFYFNLSKGLESVLSLLLEYIYFFYTSIHTLTYLVQIVNTFVPSAESPRESF